MNTQKFMQHTLLKTVTTQDVGLHSGIDITMTLRPARVGNGIVFVRADVINKDNIIHATWDNVVDTQLCTVIGNEDGITVGTVEHLMAALRGCGVDNVVVELDGAELPAMDGSSAPFVALIEQAGVIAQPLPRKAIRILKSVSIEKDGKRASLSPSEHSIFGGEIDFDHGTIGRQSYEVRLDSENFKHEIANCRTFGFLHEVEYMRSQGLALGGSLNNAIVLDENGVMNEQGLRRSDEFIRHKILDAIGDLYLAGAPILGAYSSYKAGHEMNNLLLHELFANNSAWEYVNMEADDVLNSDSLSLPHTPAKMPARQTVLA